MSLWCSAPTRQFFLSNLSLNPFFIPFPLYVYLLLSLFLWTICFPIHPSLISDPFLFLPSLPPPLWLIPSSCNSSFYFPWSQSLPQYPYLYIRLQIRLGYWFCRSLSLHTSFFILLNRAFLQQNYMLSSSLCNACHPSHLLPHSYNLYTLPTVYSKPTTRFSHIPATDYCPHFK